MVAITKRFLRDESGATAIEYALLAALIAVALITSLGEVSNSVKNTFNKVKNELNK